jgi:hypothetical protein
MTLGEAAYRVSEATGLPPLVLISGAAGRVRAHVRGRMQLASMLRADGWTIQAIARAMQLDHSTIAYYLREARRWRLPSA